MYSRKQFFYAAAKKCIDLIKSCKSFLSFEERDQATESSDLIPESLFLEAICLGIDPGTMDVEQLVYAVKNAKANSLNRETSIR